MYAFLCEVCTKPFESRSSKAMYCSGACSEKAKSNRRTEVQKQRRKEYQKRWTDENYLHRRAYSLKYMFGITLEQYEELLNRQKGCCYICGRPESDFSKKLAVDHDHSTGEIFGLLCLICNKRIIAEVRNPAIFEKAAEYLRKGGTGWFIPDARRFKAQNKKRKRKKRK